jgi:Rap1a immunity proteins
MCDGGAVQLNSFLHPKPRSRQTSRTSGKIRWLEQKLVPVKLHAQAKGRWPFISGRLAEIMKAPTVLSCLIISIAAASAQTYSANELNQYCHSNKAFVVGYVAGVLDKAEIDSKVLIDFYLQTYDVSKTAERIEKDKKKIVESFDAIDECPSMETPIEQKVDALCKFIQSNSDRRQETPAKLLRLALRAESPCK